MPDPASTGAPPGPGGPPLAAAPDLLSSLAPLLADWLPTRRWFAGHGRLITGFTLLSATELLPRAAAGGPPGLLHLLIRVAQATTPAAGAPPGGDCYQLLLGVGRELPPRLAPALIGRPAGGPLRGHAVHDALLDGRLCGLLLERLRLPGRIGALDFHREAGTAIPPRLSGRPLAAEQSHTSLVYGETLILKVFRQVTPGLNPDLELSRALAGAGCPRVPAPVAWFEARPPGGGEPTTLGVLQPFLPGCADGWHLARAALTGRADFTVPARSLGRATAEVHTALARALPTAALRRPQLESIAAGMRDRLETTARAVPVLRPYRTGLRAAFDALAAAGRGGGSWPAQRIHGDLHLGQTLRPARGPGRWSLIDFEGEPARPLAERRRPQPAVRDVAAILRSFDYAARSGPSGGDTWSLEWARRTREAYCRGYAEGGGPDPCTAPELLRAYETDKAVYEVLYEARHRPDWLPVPMAAVRRLAGGG